MPKYSVAVKELWIYEIEADSEADAIAKYENDWINLYKEYREAIEIDCLEEI